MFLRTAIIAVGALIAATAASVPASAASFGFSFSTPQASFHFGERPHGHWRGGNYRDHRVLPARAIIHRLRGYGYHRIANVHRQGRFYTARAWHPRRGWAVVRCDAYTGRVIHVRG